MRRVPLCLAVPLTFSPLLAFGDQPDPYLHYPSGPLELDVSYEARAELAAAPARPSPVSEQPRFEELDRFLGHDQPPAPTHVGKLPAGWVQVGNQVVPESALDGSIKNVEADPVWAWEDIPGNAYPRKHTVYMNFVGMTFASGPTDNSAENISTLGKPGHKYPAYTGGEQKAVAAAQAFGIDVAKYGIRVVYQQRPNKTVPYTMVMVGGQWTDTNLEDPAGGVAPGADCEARGQRHIVYVFADGGWGSISIANVASQEAAHAWGLDHTVNCTSPMAYCGSGDKAFSSTCDTLCVAGCQGVTFCDHIHKKWCDAGRQNDDAQLAWAFGGNEPDTEPPVVNIISPADGETFAIGATANLRAEVSDNYGGVGWKLKIEHDDEVILDQVDYYKDYIDDEYRAAINLAGLEEGTWTFTVEAEDHNDHITVDSVTFTVAGAGGSTGGSGSGETDSGGSGGSSTGAETGVPTTGTDPDSGGGPGSDGTDSGGFDPGAEDKACACSAETGPPGWLSLGFLPLLWVPWAGRRARGGTCD